MASKATGTRKVTVVEVGPRDGLQNESRAVRLDDKIFLARGLVAAGVRDLELGAFVRPDLVPQMADTEPLFAAVRAGKLRFPKGARVWSLVPNQRGLERAIAAGARRIAVFTAATESFARKNIGMSIDESLTEFGYVVRDALAAGLNVRGYVSTVFGCPFEGKVPPRQALRVIERLSETGVEEVSIGDTIGVATPKDIDRIIPSALRTIGRVRVAGHFHDTRGTAIANALRALDHGVRTLDSSVGGLGGCPFAPGATGNLATEDLVYMLHGLGMSTGIDLDALCKVSLAFNRRIRRPLSSRYLQAYAASH